MESNQVGHSEIVDKTAEEAVTTLLGSISYSNRDDYDQFLSNLSLEHAAIVLISAANFAQAKGIFTLDEAELIATAIKRMTTNPEPETQPSTN
jgi:hypothetical protein